MKTAPDTTTVGGIVLCGGHSSRMGLPKASLPIGQETMLERVVRLVAEVVEPVAVVAAPGQSIPELPDHVLLARDRREDRGPLAGLEAGLAVLSGHVEAAYATSCDVPLLVPGFLRSMIELLADNDAVVPVDGDFYHPLAAVYRTSVLDEVTNLLARDQLRPRFLFDTVRTRRVEVAELRSADPDLDTLTNLNRPEDYLTALKKLGLKAPEEVVAQLRLAD